jgi:hypothetical protein
MRIKNYLSRKRFSMRQVVGLLMVVFSITSGAVFAGEGRDGADEKKFNQVLIETETVIINILNDFSKKGIWLAIGGENMGNTDNVGLIPGAFITTDKIPKAKDERQLFMKPYVVKINSKTQGYCAGEFNVAKMYFDSKMLDSTGQAYVMLACGPFSKFNCSQKCKLEVRAGKWGGESRTFGSTLYFDKKEAKQEISKLKNEFKNAMMEAAEFLKFK